MSKVRAAPKRIAIEIGIRLVADSGTTMAGKAFMALWAVPFAAAATEPPAPRQAELLHMLRHDCGACHGLRLDGGLGPPLTSAAMARYAPEVLEKMILEGRPGTPMPPWKALLGPADVRWMVHAIRSGKAGE